MELLAYTDMVAAEAFVPEPPPARRLWHDPLWWLALVGLCCLVLLSTAMLIVVKRANQGAEQRERLENLTRANQQLIVQVKECVDPSGDCAQRGQQTASEAVGALSRATAVIVKCADKYDGDDAIDACIARELADKE